MEKGEKFQVMRTADHIIFFSNAVANGGAGRVISIIANSFVKQGYTVSIYSYNNNYETYKMDLLVKQNFLSNRYKNKLINKIDKILQLRRVMKANSDATIVAFEYFVNMQTIIAGLGLKNKIIISERNDPAQLNKKIIIKYLRSFLYRFADVLVCQTPDAKSYFSQTIQKKTVIIPNPIKEGLPERKSGEKKEIVNFGRIEKQKNLPLLIDAFEMLHMKYPAYSLSFYGDGSEKEWLETYIAGKGLNEHIFMYASDPDIHEKIADCIMFVSSSDYEGLSNSMLEAMAIGLPCIVTDCPCGGARMMITSYENGILVPLKDKQALFEAMAYIIENPEKAELMSKAAQNVRRQLSVEKVANKWKQIL